MNNCKTSNLVPLLVISVGFLGSFVGAAHKFNLIDAQQYLFNRNSINTALEILNPNKVNPEKILENKKNPKELSALLGVVERNYFELPTRGRISGMTHVKFPAVSREGIELFKYEYIYLV